MDHGTDFQNHKEFLYGYNGEIYLQINEIEGILKNNFGHRRI